MYKLLATILVTVLPIIATAQEPLRTLTWCLQEGLANNYSIHIAENLKLTARDNATLAGAGMLPTLDLTASYGTDLNTTHSNNRSTGMTTSNTNYLDHDVRAQVGMTWTAFDGFQMQAQYKNLCLLRQQGDLRRRIAAEDLISSITAEYYNCIQQRIRLRNFRNAVRLSRERMRIVEERYHIGSFSRLDYMQAKVDFNADSAKYMKQQEALRTTAISLNRLINHSEDLTGHIRIADTVITVATVMDYDALWNNALEYNTDMQQAALAEGIAQQSLRKALARNYPYVKLNASYGYSYDRYGVATNKWSDKWGLGAGVTVGMNLFDGTRRSNQRAARRNVENSRMEREDLQLDLRARFATLRQNHTNNLQILVLEEQNLITAQENYEIARERYLLGDLSGFEMREAQQSLLDAEERILTAAYDTKMCEISLLLISGGIEQYLY